MILLKKEHTGAQNMNKTSSVFSKYQALLGKLFLLLFLVFILALSIRGFAGNPTATDLNNALWKENGPLELSPERGRYALMYSLAEDKSFHFSVDLARFTAPDLAYSEGNYVSLFAPAVSFLAIPGYLLGKLVGLSQIGSFAMVALFAILNVYLIRAIAMRLKVHPIPATIGALAFLFASPAFAYAVTLYQHHISTFLILLSIYILLRYNSALSLFAVWTLFAFSFAVDYPNFFLFLPIIALAVIRTFPIIKQSTGVQVAIPFGRIAAVVGIIAPFAFFFWFNFMSYGNPLQLSGSLVRAIEIRPDGSPLLETEVIMQRLREQNIKIEDIEKTTVAFFQNRNMLNGFYTHILSPDRGVLMYTPIMVLGVIGLIVAGRRRKPYLWVFVGIIGMNLLLYSMWDDPYGGWAFGSRYLIPSYAILGIFLGILLQRFGKQSFFLVLFFAVMSYSVAVNTLGALTTNRVPPKVEAEALAEVSKRIEPYTYERNMEYLNVGNSKSFIYQTYAGYYMSAWQYYTYLTTFIILVSGGLIIVYRASLNETAVQQKASVKSITPRGGRKQL